MINKEFKLFGRVHVLQFADQQTTFSHCPAIMCMHAHYPLL